MQKHTKILHKKKKTNPKQAAMADASPGCSFPDSRASKYDATCFRSPGSIPASKVGVRYLTERAKKVFKAGFCLLIGTRRRLWRALLRITWKGWAPKSSQDSSLKWLFMNSTCSSCSCFLPPSMAWARSTKAILRAHSSTVWKALTRFAACKQSLQHVCPLMQKVGSCDFWHPVSRMNRSSFASLHTQIESKIDPVVAMQPAWSQLFTKGRFPGAPKQVRSPAGNIMLKPWHLGSSPPSWTAAAWWNLDSSWRLLRQPQVSQKAKPHQTKHQKKSNKNVKNIE